MASTKKLLICTFIILAIALVAGMFPVHGEGEIYDTVVRLHVLANSDSVEDQTLKLKVRDRVLEFLTPKIENCTTQTEAVAAIGGVMDELKLAAQAVIAEEGYDYNVNISVVKEHYPTKLYENCAFPEGNYVSLKIGIGEAEGENWWCCLFPPLCLSAASDSSEDSNEEAFIAVGLTGDQYKLITETDTPKYKVRFKILEVIQKWFD